MMNNMLQPKTRMEKDRGFILPVALILLFIALSAGVVASKLAMQQSQTTGSALDSFVSLNYAKEVLNLCERDVLNNDVVDAAGLRRRQQLANISATPTSVLWQTWAPGVITNTPTGGGTFNAGLFIDTPVANINAAFQAIMPAATAGGACLIEPLTNDRFILTARAMTLSTFDMVQLQSFIDFRSATPTP